MQPSNFINVAERSAALVPEHLEILRHTIGDGKDCPRRPSRNHFVTGPGNRDHAWCQDLVSAGLMRMRPGNELSGGGDIFSVTVQGVDYLNLVQVPESLPKLTRSQQRYATYLRADGGMSFGEWLRRGCYKT